MGGLLPFPGDALGLLRWPVIRRGGEGATLALIPETCGKDGETLWKKGGIRQIDRVFAIKYFTHTGSSTVLGSEAFELNENTGLHSSAHKIMMVLIAVWGRLNDLLCVIDTHSGIITALATVAIVFLTAVYVLYSKRQWETMRNQAAILQRQLKDAEASTSAHLIIEDFNPTLTMGEHGQGMLIRGSFTVTNVGSSVASEIYFVSAFAAGIIPPDPLPELKPIPVPNGPTLSPGKSIEFPIGIQAGQWDAVENGKWFVSFQIAVSYRNIFGEPAITPACLMYYYQLKKVSPMPCIRSRTWICSKAAIQQKEAHKVIQARKNPARLLRSSSFKNIPDHAKTRCWAP